jgi:uncharacterized protein (UPF0548 family)
LRRLSKAPGLSIQLSARPSSASSDRTEPASGEGKEWERSQVQTARWRLFQTAGKIVRHGRQVFLKNQRAMLAAFAAIRERCARVMREGGAIPETA